MPLNTIIKDQVLRNWRMGVFTLILMTLYTKEKPSQYRKNLDKEHGHFKENHYKLNDLEEKYRSSSHVFPIFVKTFLK